MQRRKFVALLGGAYVGLRASGLKAVELAVQSVAGRDPEESARDEDFWLQIRHAFTVDRNSINLNNGSVCPAPRPVQKAMEDYWAITNMSPSLYVDEILYPQIALIRRRLAAAFGCDAEDLAITRNTTEALEIVQFGMDLKPGDEILTTTQDYPSMITTWRQGERSD